MGDLIQAVREFFQKGDVLETIILYLSDHYELLLVIAAVIFILVLSLSVILERLQKSSWIALVPIYRFVVIFKAIGIKSWCVFLMLIPGVNIFMRVYFYIVLVKKFRRNYGFVPLLVILPLLFLPIVAFGEGRHIYISKDERKSKQKVREMQSRQKLEEKREQKKRKKLSAEQFKKTFKQKCASINDRLAGKKAEQEEEMEESWIGVSETEEKTEEVLSMAQVRENRAQVRAERELARESRAPLSQPSVPMNKPVQTKDMMPMMRQGPMGQRAELEKDGAYERLLRQQEEEQRLREQRRQRIVPNRAVVVEKPVAKAAPVRPAGHKKIDF
ncbi:hypothetical protein IKG06_00035 [Candidatus Saccharibacteria bacterium]|nr:hypothetical protein [Candidatus Saccharibacteria bacterium]